MKKQIYVAPHMVVTEFKMNQKIMTTSNVGFGSNVSSAAGAEGREFDLDFDEE